MNNKKRLLSVAVLFALTILTLCTLSPHAYGFVVSRTDGGAEIHWSTPSAGISLNTAYFPSGSLQAIQTAMQTWTNVSTSNFSFVYQGYTASTAYAVQDGTNLICFGSFDDPGYDTTLALNTFWYTTQQGQLLDSDIKFNSAFSWATNRSATAYDVQTIALHELGHTLSLEDLIDDSADKEKVMYGYCSPGQIKRSLTQDDKNGITYLYSGGLSTSSTTTVPSSTTTTISPVPVTQCPAEKVLGQDNPDIASLRAFRDGTLARSAVGRRLTQIYYDNAESINAALDRSPSMQAMARKFFEAIALLARRIQ